MNRWQYIILARPERIGGNVTLILGDVVALATRQPDEAAYALYIRWRDKARLPVADLLKVECWARLEAEPGVCGVVYGRDWT